MEHQFSRRDFVRNSFVLAATLPLTTALGATHDSSSTSGHPAPPPRPAPLHWLDGNAPLATVGNTWGVPWPAGQLKKDTAFSLKNNQGTPIPVQSWPLAWWPDGTIKWTGHAMPANAPLTDELTLQPGKTTAPAQPVTVTNTPTSILINTGLITCQFAKQGNILISTLSHGNTTVGKDGQLILLREDRSGNEEESTIRSESFSGNIHSTTVEQTGPVRAVVKIEGTHTNSNRTLLPFTLRFYFYSGSEAIRILHTITYDGDENKDFIKGIGLRFSVPLTGALHDRHIRFAGEDQGVFAEAVRGLTGLRRDPGTAVTNAQLNGLATPPITSFPAAVSTRLDLIPAFGDYTLFQHTADSFDIRKRTQPGYTWLQSGYGHRSAGLAYLGTPTGGLAFGIRNFWQSHPAQLDIRNAILDTAHITLWVWGPDAAAMDLRFYHDGMGQNTFEKQREGLEITYEDYEPGFGTAHGVARTSEILLWALPATPSREQFTTMASQLSTPPVLACTPGYLQSMAVFGGNWSLPDRTIPSKALLEDQLDQYFDFYHHQVNQRQWYGFWNYGDVMHTYDSDRHVWRYDVGGFAWDNSELSTDLWLWYYFLRTGRADVFRMAEAMTRHTGEVDVYHLGRFAPLGSRHNVLHWGCSAKQLRISTAANRRFYYYLTADERVGDLMREQVHADKALVETQPGRKLGKAAPLITDLTGEKANISFGTDWGALAAAWLTEWERTANPQVRDKLLNSMHTIATQPFGFFSASAEMDLATGRFNQATGNKPAASHLNAVFGLAEICAELITLTSQPDFEQAWLQYCTLYSATEEEQKAALGQSLGKLNLKQGHARLTAYAAQKKNDAALGARAWKEFYGGDGGISRRSLMTIHHLEGPTVLNPIDEGDISTNAVAQWSLAAMQCLAFAGNSITGNLAT